MASRTKSKKEQKDLKRGKKMEAVNPLVVAGVSKMSSLKRSSST
ncbi:MAG TPA: hypothetical protein VMH00_07475 [Candidatus Limnocylindrales bacterium]|nr:hypothetical protein [Candidatus Limnocylindrales bacterium]